MKKLLNKKGFTLMEMMIVIAIIVILVAISIPAMSGSLEKAHKATDAANFRGAKAAYIAAKMGGEFKDAGVYYYDYKDGKFIKTDSVSDAKTTAGSKKSLGSCSHHADDCIIVTVTATTVSEMTWSDTDYTVDCDTDSTPSTP